MGKQMELPNMPDKVGAMVYLSGRDIGTFVMDLESSIESENLIVEFRRQDGEVMCDIMLKNRNAGFIGTGKNLLLALHQAKAKYAHDLLWGDAT